MAKYIKIYCAFRLGGNFNAFQLLFNYSIYDKIKERMILRAKNIDILKALCAFLVVCIHAPFPGKSAFALQH